MKRRQRGFTLLEVLLVVAIAGIALGAISLSIGRADDPSAALREEGESIARLLQMVRSEAILRNRQTAFEANAARYRFLVREDKGWQPLAEDGVFREREFKSVPMRMLLEPEPKITNPIRIVFGREPIDAPFVLALAHGTSRVLITADGAGRFHVVQP